MLPGKNATKTMHDVPSHGGRDVICKKREKKDLAAGVGHEVRGKTQPSGREEGPEEEKEKTILGR